MKVERGLRVAISQRFLPHYRIGVFDELASRIHAAGGAFRLFYSYEMGTLPRVPSWAERVPAARTQLQLGELEESAVVAPNLFARLARYRPDVVVLEDLASLPNSILGAAYCRLVNKPYLIWDSEEFRRNKNRDFDAS